MRLALRPIFTQDAIRWLAPRHRHNNPPLRGLFAASVVDETGAVRGVAVAARPVARNLDNGATIEVTRCCTDGAENACSMLYGALRRAAWALGYSRIVTYTLAEEPGTSLKASGWTRDAELAASPTWSRPSRHRLNHDLFGHETRPAGAKVRWVCVNPARTAEAPGAGESLDGGAGSR